MKSIKIIKSLLPSLCQREGMPLFGKEGAGEIFQMNVFSIESPFI
jgi:hypothetical protein